MSFYRFLSFYAFFYFNYHLDRQGSPWSFVASLTYCFAGTSNSECFVFLIAQKTLKSYYRVNVIGMGRAKP